MRTRTISALLLVGGSLQMAACGNTDHPPPVDTRPPPFYKANCVCTIPWSPAAQSYLGLTAPTSSITVDGCLPIQNDFSNADQFCSTNVAGFVESEVQDILKSRTAAFGDLACSGVALSSAVTCSLQNFANQSGSDATMQFPTLGVKEEPNCAGRNAPSVSLCDFGDDSKHNCDVKADPATITACTCNTVTGCDGTQKTLSRGPTGNADDPPATVTDPTASPIGDIAFGRHDGTIDPAQSRLDATGTGRFCVDLLIKTVCDSVSDTEHSAISGGFSVYGRACPGSSCPVSIELNLAAGDLNFDLSLLGISVASRHISNILLFGGSGDAPVMVDASGHGVVPANTFQYRAFAKDGGEIDQAIGTLAQPVDFFVDWQAQTLRFPAFPISLSGASATVSLEGSFGASLLEQTSNLCPKPKFADQSSTLASSCSVAGPTTFAAPALQYGCSDTPATITGQVVSVNGSTLASPIPIVNGLATVPHGSATVRWTATDTLGRTDSVLQTVQTFTSPTISTADTLDVRDRAFVQDLSGAFAAVANSGHSSTIGTDASVGELDTNAAAQLRDRAKITSLLFSPQQPTLFNGASYGSWQRQTPAYAPFPALPPPSTSTVAIYLAPDTTRALAPGAYGAVTLQPRSHLILTAGDYSFTSFDFESTAHLAIDTSQGPVRITTGAVTLFRGTFDLSTEKAKSFTFGYTGSAPLFIESAFEGTLIAPDAEVTLRALNQGAHFGQFFAKTMHVDAGAKVVHNVLGCE